MVPPLVDAAKSLGLSWAMAMDSGGDYLSGKEEEKPHFNSQWLTIARKSADLDYLKDTKSTKWTVPASTGQHLWRDGAKIDLDPLKRAGKK
jgi:hypothetical protein